MQKKGSKGHDYLRDNPVSNYNKAFITLIILFISLFVISEFNINNITKTINFFKTEDKLLDDSVHQIKSLHLHNENPPFDLNDIEEDSDELPDKNKLPDSNILDSEEFDNLRLIQKNIESFIHEDQLSGIIGTKLTSKGLHILVYTDTVFEKGYANLLAEGLILIEELAEYIVIHEQHDIVVIGHADDLAVESEKLKSDWELSAMRAMQVMQLLTENIALKETKFSAQARGDNDPLITSPTKGNEHLNRRVEVIVKPIFTNSPNKK